MAGVKIGMITCIERVGTSKRRQAKWLCLCDCGNTFVANGCDIRTGNTGSCGCLQRKRTSDACKKHGMSYGNSEYKIWIGIKSRCYTKTNLAYKNYGGRGIRVCGRWVDSFENFLADMGPRPSSRHSIDRIDNDGDYCPENCQWTTTGVQCNNTRKNRNFLIGGVRVTLKQACELLGGTVGRARHRIAAGIPPSLAFEFPAEVTECA